MEDFHALARQALSGMLCRVARVGPGDICTRVRGAAASAPLRWRTDMEPAAALELALGGELPAVLGAPLVETAFLRNGHVCFRFTKEAYGAMQAQIIASVPPPPLPDPGMDEPAYAVARMLMLARKGGRGCPVDPRAQEALWLALGIPGLAGRAREAQRLKAARAFTGLFWGRPVKERQALAPALGETAACAARLLAYGWKEAGALAKAP